MSQAVVENPPQKTKRVRKKFDPTSRIWELDFLRGFCILLMCVDHLFVDVYTMYRNWSTSEKSFFANFYHAAARYMGYSSDKVLVPLETMQICEYVFLWLIILLVTISFIVKIAKAKTKPTKSQVIDYSLAMAFAVLSCVAMVIVNNTVGYADGTANSRHTARDFIHQIVLWFFFLLCGIGCRLSKNNFKRFLQIAICAGLISLFTYLAEVVLKMSGVLVLYGVLHMLATAVLVYAVIELIWKLIFKKPEQDEKRKYAISITCFIFGVAFYFLNQYLWQISDSLPANDWLAWFHEGFCDVFQSSDYFKLCESLPMIMFGAAIGPFIYPEKKSLFPELQPINKGVFCFMGRHTLWVVLIHQLVLSGSLFLIDLAC